MDAVQSLTNQTALERAKKSVKAFTSGYVSASSQFPVSLHRAFYRCDKSAYTHADSGNRLTAESAALQPFDIAPNGVAWLPCAMT